MKPMKHLVFCPRSSFEKFEQDVRIKLNSNPPRSPFFKGGILSKARKPLFGKEGQGRFVSANFCLTMLGNLALALLATGDSAWARRHFEKAVSGFETLGIEYASDLQAVAENYCAVLQAEGDYAHAETIAARVPGGMAMPEPELA